METAILVIAVVGFVGAMGVAGWQQVRYDLLRQKSKRDADALEEEMANLRDGSKALVEKLEEKHRELAAANERLGIQDGQLDELKKRLESRNTKAAEPKRVRARSMTQAAEMAEAELQERK